MEIDQESNKSKSDQIDDNSITKYTKNFKCTKGEISEYYKFYNILLTK